MLKSTHYTNLTANTHANTHASTDTVKTSGKRARYVTAFDLPSEANHEVFTNTIHECPACDATNYALLAAKHRA